MSKLPSERLNDFVDNVISPHEINCEIICKANDILDWLMQKGWSKSLTYTSYPDETVYTVKEGLKQVFDIIQSMDASLREIRALYNEELYKAYELLENAPNAEELKKLQKLEQIKALLK